MWKLCTVLSVVFAIWCFAGMPGMQNLLCATGWQDKIPLLDKAYILGLGSLLPTLLAVLRQEFSKKPPTESKIREIIKLKFLAKICITN